MSTGRPPPGSIPTLTEVVSWPAVAPPAAAAPANALPAIAPPAIAAPIVALPVAPPTAPTAAPAAPAAAPVPALAQPAAAAAPVAPVIDEAQLRQRVLADIQKQVDLMLEVRLREALAPAIGRATDAFARDARKELASTLRDIVAQSVARELGRREER